VRTFDEVAVELLVEYPWVREPHWGAMRYRPGQVVAEPVVGADGARAYAGAWTTHDGAGIYVAAFTLDELDVTPSSTAFRRDERGVREVGVPRRFRPPAAMRSALALARETHGRVERSG
jgi:hypothetical protein